MGRAGKRLVVAAALALLAGCRSCETQQQQSEWCVKACAVPGSQRDFGVWPFDLHCVCVSSSPTAAPDAVQRPRRRRSVDRREARRLNARSWEND